MTARPVAPNPGPLDRTVRAVLLALSFAGGTVDAATYLGIGHVFPANMTGNTVLMAIAVVRHGDTELVRAAVALGAFCVGVAVGTLALRDTGRWPQTAALALGLEAGLLAIVLGSWEGFGLSPRYWLIAIAAVAMGTQSAAVRALHLGGVSTTYVTGTLTTAVARLVARMTSAPPRAPASPALPGESWIVYALGALAGGFAEHSWQGRVMAIPLALVLASTLTALWRRRTEER